MTTLRRTTVRLPSLFGMVIAFACVAAHSEPVCASCGDWLDIPGGPDSMPSAAHLDPASGHAVAAVQFSGGRGLFAGAVGLEHESNRHRPCHGPTCRQAPESPGTAAQIVGRAIPSEWFTHTVRRPAPLVAVSSFPRPASEPMSETALRGRIERPPAC